MKKINASGLFVVVIVAAALMMQYHYNKEKEPSNKQRIPATPNPEEVAQMEQAKKAAKMELFQDQVSRLYEGYSPCLNYGVFGKDGTACVKIGHGVPISKEDLKDIMSNTSNFYKEQSENAGNYYDSIIEEKKNMNNMSFPADIIRQYEAGFIEKRQEEEYRPLCRIHGFEYDDIPFEARVAIFCIDMATGGRIESYGLFLDAVGKRDWEEASKQAYVDAKKVYLVKNPYVVPKTPDLFNKNMRNLFLQMKEFESVLLTREKGNIR